MNFDEVAGNYERLSKVQNRAGLKLIELLEIGRNDDVIDVGCGNGSLTAVIRRITSGRVVGIDSSRRMIEEARKRVNAEFYVVKAEEMNFKNEFDVVFCNSAFQWFNADRALEKFRECLRIGGKAGVQAPARKVYCPNFVKAVEKVRNSEIGKIFEKFRSPWFFLESENEYRELFERHGFSVEYCKIEEVVTEHTPEEVFKIFCSGAVAAYLNPDFYACKITEEYKRKFLEIVKSSFYEQAKNGVVKLKFYRVFVIACL